MQRLLYETINTRHARRPDWIARFENIVRSRDTEFIDDAPYRLDAFDEVMLTFNLSDFAGICSAKGVHLL